MTPLHDSVLTIINGVPSPKSDHCFFLRISPQKDNVTCRIAVGEGQTDDFPVETLGDLCVRDRKMGLVKGAYETVRTLVAPLYLVSMPFGVVFVSLAVFFVPRRLV